jgi:peptide/nickel transport system substrate-binding protein
MEEIAEFVHAGTARPSDAAIAPGIFGYTPVGRYAYDPERARQLLAEAGYPNGFDTQLFSPTARYPLDIQTSEAIQSQLAEVGINASIETMEWNAYIAMTGRPVDENEITMAMLGWGTVTGDADYGLYALFHTSQHPPVGFNRGFYSNPEIDSLLDDARSTNDPELRQSLYAMALQILRDDAAWLFLYSEAQIVAIRDDVQGLIIHPTERCSPTTRRRTELGRGPASESEAGPLHRLASCPTGYLVCCRSWSPRAVVARGSHPAGPGS